MALTTAGRDLIATAVVGDAFTAFNNANAYLGVGDSSTAFSAAQTDLQASTNKLRKAMDSTYPQRTANLHIWTPAVENTAGNADNDYSGNGNNWTAGGTLTLEDGPPIAWMYADEDYESYTSAAPPPTALVDLIGMGIIPWAR